MTFQSRVSYNFERDETSEEHEHDRTRFSPKGGASGMESVTQPYTRTASPSQQPLAPPSPPDTIVDQPQSTTQFPSVALRALQAERERQGAVGTSSRRPDGRRQGSISFGSGSQAIRNLGGANRGRSVKKWLILVVPPEVLPHSPPPPQISGFAHGYGASGRYSGGILMPLQSSMAAQISLIAREFSLPSIAGISIYLSLPAEEPRRSADNGAAASGYAAPPPALKPKVLDECWQTLWAAYLDEETSFTAEGLRGLNGLPVAARVEFDVDARRARWLPGWIESAQPGATSAPQNHRLSGTRLASLEEDREPSTGYRPPTQAFTEEAQQRRVPRPLSLASRPALSRLSTQQASLPPQSSFNSALRIDISPSYSHRSATTTSTGPLSLNDAQDWPVTPPSPDRLPSADIAHRHLALTPSAVEYFTDKSLESKASLVPTPAPVQNTLVERDWAIKIRPLWEISGTPTPLSTAFDIEPRTLVDQQRKTYPFFNLYPAVYPHFSLYPSFGPVIPRPMASGAAFQLPEVRVAVSPRYPFLVIYPPVYPHSATSRALYPVAAALSPSPPPPLFSAPLILLHQPSLEWGKFGTPLSPDRRESASVLDVVMKSAGSTQPGIDRKQWFDKAARQASTGGRYESRTAPRKPMRSMTETNPHRSIETAYRIEGDGTKGPPAPLAGLGEDEPRQVDDDRDESDSDFGSDQEGNDEDSCMTYSSFPVPASDHQTLTSPVSPAFAYSSASPTLNASQINGTFRKAGNTPPLQTDDLPFILSPRFDNDGLDIEARYGSHPFPEDDDGSAWQYLLMGPLSPCPDTNQPPHVVELSTNPLLFTFPCLKQSDDLTAAVAQYIFEAQRQSIERRGKFYIALAGGSMPQILAEALIGDDRIVWEKWEVFFVDERLVPLSDPESTFYTYHKHLFRDVPIPPSSIHSIKSLPDLQLAGAMSLEAIEEIATDYETQLIAAFPGAYNVNGPGLVPGPPRFDLCLLGIGPDGHCASLFPDHPLLNEQDWWIGYLTDSPKSPLARITFTLPLLSASRRLAFVCTGDAKAEALSRILDLGSPPEHTLPAARIKLDGHPVVFFCDEAAAGSVEYPQSQFWEVG